MTSVRVHIGISLDGFGAGPRQDLEHPLGVHGEDIMAWFFPTRFFQRMYGDSDGESRQLQESINPLKTVQSLLGPCKSKQKLQESLRKEVSFVSNSSERDESNSEDSLSA